VSVVVVGGFSVMVVNVILVW